jgi:hypothetical protein
MGLVHRLFSPKHKRMPRNAALHCVYRHLSPPRAVGAVAMAVCGKASSLLLRFGVKTLWQLYKLCNRHRVDGFAIG